MRWEILPFEKEIIQNRNYLKKEYPELFFARAHTNMLALKKYASSLKAQGKKFEYWDNPEVYPVSDETFARFILVNGAINFFYWLHRNPYGIKKFTVEHRFDGGGKTFSGAFAMDKCFLRALNQSDITADWLEQHFESLETARHFFNGINEIPMLEQRFWNMREMIDVLRSKFQGDPKNVYEEAGWDAARLVALLVSRFSNSFGGDVSNLNLVYPPKYQMLVFPFYKLAKLVPTLYQGRAMKPGSKLRQLSGMESIVAICDYDVPKALRYNNVLVFSEDLAKKIDTEQIIHRHSLEELAFRAEHTFANYLIFKEINKGLDQDHPDFWNIANLDPPEWFSGRNSPNPHPRVPTPAY